MIGFKARRRVHTRQFAALWAELNGHQNLATTMLADVPPAELEAFNNALRYLGGAASSLLRDSGEAALRAHQERNECLPAPQAAELGESLAAGLSWFEMEQPEAAIASHLGAHGGRTGGGRFGINVCPHTVHGYQSVVFRVANKDRRANVLTNPITPAEVQQLRDIVAAFVPVVDSWNGDHPEADSVSFGIDHGLHPSLERALANYRAGCPAHDGTVFCDRRDGCPWWSDGHKLMRFPAGWS